MLMLPKSSEGSKDRGVGRSKEIVLVWSALSNERIVGEFLSDNFLDFAHHMFWAEGFADVFICARG